MPPPARSRVFWLWSFCCSYPVVLRQVARFLEPLEVVGLQLRGARRRSEAEVSFRAARVPLADLHRELRGLVDTRAGDHVAAGIGRGPLRDPDLPVGVLGAEGEMVALLPADNPAAQILDVGDIGHQLVIDTRLQEIGAGELAVEL